ncbi:MAG: diaminohydroxyphosphoribosylaminopyrimidine deaminase [Candidatus Azotimanducaceae bacterium]
MIGPILESSAISLNPGHFKKYQNNLPYVRLKLAQSLDGRTALANGASQWITGAEARRDVQKLRARSCAVVTGVDTVIADNPSLNVRAEDLSSEQATLAEQIRRPIVVLDSMGRLPASAKLVSDPNLIVASLSQRTDLDVQQCVIEPDDKGQIDLQQLLQFLVQQEDCSEILFECGATLAGSLIQSGLLDELVLYIAPKLMGSGARGLIQLDELLDMSDAPTMSITDSRQIGDDLRLTLQNKKR